MCTEHDLFMWMLFRFYMDNMQIVFSQYSGDICHEPHFEFGRLFAKKKGSTINSVQKITYFDQNHEWKAGKR